MMPRGTSDGSADRRIGANTWQPWMGPHRLMPSTHCQSSKGQFADGGTAGADAGVVDYQRGCSAEPRFRLGGQFADVVELGYVARDRDGLTAVVGDRAHRSLGGDFIDVAADHPTAAAGEFDGERRADPAARAGHHRTRVVAHLVRPAKRPEHAHLAFAVAGTASVMRLSQQRMVTLVNGNVDVAFGNLRSTCRFQARCHILTWVVASIASRFSGRGGVPFPC